MLAAPSTNASRREKASTSGAPNAVPGKESEAATNANNDDLPNLLTKNLISAKIMFLKKLIYLDLIKFQVQRFFYLKKKV